MIQEKPFLTSAELCLTVVSKGRDRAAADSPCDRCHHAAQHEAGWHEGENKR